MFGLNGTRQQVIPDLGCHLDSNTVWIVYLEKPPQHNKKPRLHFQESTLLINSSILPLPTDNIQTVKIPFKLNFRIS